MRPKTQGDSYSITQQQKKTQNAQVDRNWDATNKEARRPTRKYETMSCGVLLLHQRMHTQVFNLNVSIMNGKDVLFRLAHWDDARGVKSYIYKIEAHECRKGRFYWEKLIDWDVSLWEQDNTKGGEKKFEVCNRGYLFILI